MATNNEENWMMHYNELKAYVAVHHHFPQPLGIWKSIREEEERRDEKNDAPK